MTEFDGIHVVRKPARRSSSAVGYLHTIASGSGGNIIAETARGLVIRRLLAWLAAIHHVCGMTNRYTIVLGPWVFEMGLVALSGGGVCYSLVSHYDAFAENIADADGIPPCYYYQFLRFTTPPLSLKRLPATLCSRMYAPRRTLCGRIRT